MFVFNLHGLMLVMMSHVCHALFNSIRRVKFVFHVLFVHDLESNCLTAHMSAGLGTDHLSFPLTLDNAPRPGPNQRTGLSRLSWGT